MHVIYVKYGWRHTSDTKIEFLQSENMDRERTMNISQNAHLLFQSPQHL